MKEEATSRIAVRPAFQRTIRELAAGAGMKQGAVLELLFEAYLKEGESPVEFGRRLAAEHAARQPARPGDA